MKRKDLDCENCRYVVPLLPGNNEALDLISQVGPGLISGDGRVDYSAIKFIMDMNHIPHKERRDMFDKIQVYIKLQLQHMAKEMERSFGKKDGPSGMRT